ncbi:LacI family DNA-binding transcriptional regulator [Erwinia sp. AnSW2-5]|uniref:LacI family DNA-binding transcriptional regulator n=1 Tax=Erwinia sp. AnSW2-5 TaxID=3367692 RepID=UPI00385B630E
MKNTVKEKQTQKATASEVAELAGASKWTVLRAFKPDVSISPLAREGVLATAKKTGSRPGLLAHSLKPRRTHIIGVVADEFSNPHTLKMLNEVTRQLNERGSMALLLNVDSDANYQSVLQMAGQLQVDALLFLATISSDELVVAVDELHPIPSIHVCRGTDSADVDVVSVDGYAAGAEIGRLLLSQGYHRFGYMKGHETSSTHLLRMEGYAASLDAADKTLNKVLVAGHCDREMAYQTMMTYLKNTWASERVDALFCENDVLAFGAMQAIRDFGQGTHIGVVGFDDVGEARSSMWNLTTWAQRCDLQIAEALNRLLDNRADEKGAWRKGELKIRHSHLSREVHGEMAQCGCACRS